MCDKVVCVCERSCATKLCEILFVTKLCVCARVVYDKVVCDKVVCVCKSVWQSGV